MIDFDVTHKSHEFQNRTVHVKYISPMETSMKTKQVVLKKYQSEYRNIWRLMELSGISGLLEFHSREKYWFSNHIGHHKKKNCTLRPWWKISSV